MTSIAFLGLGTMGSAMASNLQRAGHQVIGWNRTGDRPSVQQFASGGGTVVSDLRDAVVQATCVITCLADAPDVAAVLLGSGGVADHALPQTLVIDTSTIGAIAAREIGQVLEARSLRFLDAPISGGDVGARHGSLTFMVGGSPEDYNTAVPLLEAMGKTIRHCGPMGNGQAMKLCNQTLAALHMVAVCEALRLADQFHLDPQLMVDVCGSGAAASWMLSHLGMKAANQDFTPGFMIQHMQKDLRHIQASMAEAGETLPGVNLAAELFAQVFDPHLGTPALIRAYPYEPTP
ncbi:MAG: NAD(P)-dependent oxidoreductase [Oscillatoriales cyanobacterium SM2_2_1]|nr:NAD(P)-dependent oxidoreductase [Oscillatoriales cyanobacterium SM2_2_1]